MTLIPDWKNISKKAWSMYVGYAVVILNAASAGWMYFNGNIDPLWFAGINMALGVAVNTVRLLDQNLKATQE
jgi:hypothetical protein